jgi:hypothetical protein
MYYNDESITMYDIIKACVKSVTSVRSSSLAWGYAAPAMPESGARKPSKPVSTRAYRTETYASVVAESRAIEARMCGCPDINALLINVCVGAGRWSPLGQLTRARTALALACQGKHTHNLRVKRCRVRIKESRNRLHIVWQSPAPIVKAEAHLANAKRSFVSGQSIKSGARQCSSATIIPVKIAAHVTATAKKSNWKPIILSPSRFGPISYCQWQMGGHYV